MQYLLREYTSEGYVDRNGNTLWSLIQKVSEPSKIIARISTLKQQFPYHRCELYARKNENDKYELVFDLKAKDIKELDLEL